MQVVLQLVKSIASNRAPRFEADADSAFMGQVRAKLAHYLVLPASAGGSGDVDLFGADAVKKIFTELLAKRDRNEALTLADLQQVLVFHFLLSEDQVKTVEEIRQAIVASGPDVVRPGAKVAAAKTGAAKAKAKAGDKKKCVSSPFKKL